MTLYSNPFLSGTMRGLDTGQINVFVLFLKSSCKKAEKPPSVLKQNLWLSKTSAYLWQILSPPGHICFLRLYHAWPAHLFCELRCSHPSKGFPGGSEEAKEGDAGSIPGSGRFPGEGNGNPLQYPCLGNPINRILAGYSPWGH